jgi:ferredoxin
MVKYRVTISKELCIDCGISIGRCPTHAKSLSKIVACSGDLEVLSGTFSEDFYPRIKELAESCPVKAIIIEKIDE